MKETVRFLQAQDLKDMMGISLRGVYDLMARPDFPAIKVTARRYVVSEEAFKRWLDEQIEKKALRG